MRVITKKSITAFCALAMLSVSYAQETDNDIMLANGIKYLGTPYAAHTLDTNATEELILNCDEVDCTTFIEYVLAESLCPIINGDICNKPIVFLNILFLSHIFLPICDQP